MSERGTFVTEYIYDQHDFDILAELLLNKKDRKYLTSIQIKDMPIIAGKIGDTNFKFDYLTLMITLEEVKNDLNNIIKITCILECGDIVLITVGKGNIDTITIYQKDKSECDKD